LGILQDVPIGVDVAEQRASNVLPVNLGVRGRGNGEVLLGSGNRPASLGDPNCFPASDANSVFVSLVESRVGNGDAVVDGVLEVG